MKQNMLFLMGVLALLLASPNANADDKEKYKLFAEETRKEIWALELPEFANTAVPEKYKDESAVILAAHVPTSTRSSGKRISTSTCSGASPASSTTTSSTIYPTSTGSSSGVSK